MNSKEIAIPLGLSASITLVMLIPLVCICACMGNLTYKDPKTKKNELTGFTIFEIVCGSIAIISLIVALILYFKKS